MLKSKPLGTNLNRLVPRRTRLNFSKLNTPEFASYRLHMGRKSFAAATIICFRKKRALRLNDWKAQRGQILRSG